MDCQSDPPDPLAAPETSVTSFVIRFVQDASAPAGRWHGLIRHVQSDAELHFAAWAEAEAFIARHVPLGRQPEKE